MFVTRVVAGIVGFLALLVACTNPAEPTTVTSISTPSPTQTPEIPTQTPEIFWEYIGFTHAPIDFEQTLVEAPSCASGSMLMPFFNYLNMKHAESPKKWYIIACAGDPVKVYLPSKALLRTRNINVSGSDGTYNGEKVLTDVKVYFEASTDITLFFMHLALLADIKSQVDQSSSGYSVLEAGTHIGYVYAPNRERYSLDFGVEDKSVDPGLTFNDDHWWNIRVNPLDYFTKETKQSILETYQNSYQRLVDNGTTAFADLEDSRLDLNENGKIWGVWFKDEFPNAFSSDSGHSGTAWSVINVVRTDDLTQETYWKILQKFPDSSGFFVEQALKDALGQSLYEGGPIGENRFFILSGDDTFGIARIVNRRDWEGSRTMYLKYEIIRHSESKVDDMLRIEAFITQDEAEMNGFSEKAVRFRRTPCEQGATGCR